LEGEDRRYRQLEHREGPAHISSSVRGSLPLTSSRVMISARYTMWLPAEARPRFPRQRTIQAVGGTLSSACREQATSGTGKSRNERNSYRIVPASRRQHPIVFASPGPGTPAASTRSSPGPRGQDVRRCIQVGVIGVTAAHAVKPVPCPARSGVNLPARCTGLAGVPGISWRQLVRFLNWSFQVRISPVFRQQSTRSCSAALHSWRCSSSTRSSPRHADVLRG